MSQLQERLEFIKLDKKSIDKLKSLKPLVRRHLPKVLDDFYKHINQYPSMAKMFASDESQNRAYKLQQRHWMNIVSGEYNDEYVASTKRIGRMHSKIGLEPQWYMGGYAVIGQALAKKIVLDTLSGPTGSFKKKKLAEGMSAFMKAFVLDMELAISTYLDAEKDANNKHLETLGNTFNEHVKSIVTRLEGSSESSASNVQTVATASEELSASIHEISTQVSHTAKSADETVDIITNASEQVKRLSDSADKIGEIVGMIQAIAEQTNLLALNATIEAARAGEAGKGFAVVANEVKSLAGKTAVATKDIVEQIQTIQAETKKTVQGVDQVVLKVNDVQERSASVAAAVEEQQAATSEISQSVQKVSSDVQSTHDDIRELKKRVNDFLQTIAQKADDLQEELTDKGAA